MKRVSLVALAIIIVGVLVYVFWPKTKPVEIVKNNYSYSIIGKSVESRDLEAYTYGSGSKHLVFVGGIHGGYEANSVELAKKFIDYLNSDVNFVPADFTITVIPSVNPDGVAKVATSSNKAPGRFNAHAVDLNRNFDCAWKATSTWQNKIVSAGTSAFSEPEAQALRDFFLKTKPTAVVFWHSQSNAVYASQCGKGILPETLNLMNTYSIASGYKAVNTFDAYAVTGAADDWLASIGIPAITVELSTHEAIEWDKNLAGIKALLNYEKSRR